MRGEAVQGVVAEARTQAFAEVRPVDCALAMFFEQVRRQRLQRRQVIGDEAHRADRVGQFDALQTRA